VSITRQEIADITAAIETINATWEHYRTISSTEFTALPFNLLRGRLTDKQIAALRSYLLTQEAGQ
jgi:hypothetical protein